jgi:8-oxo-dGTP pyrophosphatase MutT (NUDIX family)
VRSSNIVRDIAVFEAVPSLKHKMVSDLDIQPDGPPPRRRELEGDAMSAGRQAAVSALVDFAWRTAFRVAFPVARIWWRLTEARGEGALVAVYVGPALLLVRVSYRRGWHLPGGSVSPGEMPEAAARRELAEEIGLTVPVLLPAGDVFGFWDGRRGRVHFFELRLAELPALKLDNREIVEARLTPPDELPGMMLTGASAAYLSKVRQ